MDHRIPLSKLEVFRCVVERGGVVRAATHLHLTQPVVTGHIRSLEQRVGTRLFRKQGRRLVLTESGRIVYQWACDLGRRTGEMEEELGLIGSGKAGFISLWAGPSVGSYQMPEVVSDFAVRHPRARITMEVGHPQHVSEKVEAGECDFGVLATDVMPQNPALRADVVGWEEMYLVARADSVHAPTGRVSPDHVPEIPFIAAPSGTIMRDLEDRQLAGVGVTRRRVVLEVGHPSATLTALLRDLGLALLFSSSARREIEAGRLRRIEFDGLEVSVPIVIITRAASSLSALQRELITDIEAALAQPAHRASSGRDGVHQPGDPAQ